MSTELNGKDVRAERARYGFSQSQLAAEIPKVSRWTISQIEDDVVELSQRQYQEIIDIIRRAGVTANR